ncbi:MAG: ABC transporter permease [Flavobacteriaceae bacterium]|nr:ABC transporter permease [Flavobacteriaceae bacterium]
MILIIAKKDIKLFLKDKKGVLLTFLLPILLITLFAFAFGGIGKSSTKMTRIKLIVSTEYPTEKINKVIADLRSVKQIKLIEKPLEEGLELVKKGSYVAQLVLETVIENGIPRLKYQLFVDESKRIQVGFLEGVLRQYVVKGKMARFFSEKFAGMSVKLRQKIKKEMNDTFQSSGLEVVSVSEKEVDKDSLGLIQAVSGTAIMMLLFSIVAVGGGLLDEKENGTFKRLITAPIKPLHLLFGKLVMSICVSVVQLLMMFLFAWIAFDLHIFKDVISLLAMVFCTAFAVSGFGVFLVSIVKTRQQLNGVSTLIIMTMSALGGSMIPLFVMPVFMQKIAVVSLNYWGIQGFYDIFWRNLSFIDILPRMLVLLGIGGVMLLISMPLFKRNLQELS